MALLGYAQQSSNADRLYAQGRFEEAVFEYLEERGERPLLSTQRLNLAHSYYRTGKYQEALDTYYPVFEKDSTLPLFHLDRMLASMKRTGKQDLAWKVFKTSPDVPKAYGENANFNYKILAEEPASPAESTPFLLAGNSPGMDFSPAFYNDRLLFSSSRTEVRRSRSDSREGYLDLYVGRIGPDGNILNTNTFTEIPGHAYHEGTPYWSEGLQKLFYIRSNTAEGELQYSSQGRNTLAIVMTDFNDLQYLLRDLNTSFYYPFYEEKSRKLYFAAELEDSFGGTDLYYVYTNNGLIMSAPVNLGPRVNGPGNEIAPYIHEGTLYFASDVFYGLGGMDIYKSEVQPDGTFSIPVNLGHGINSPYDDFAYIIRKDERGGYISYFTSNRPGGPGSDDLYGVKQQSKPGLQTLVFKGRVNSLEGNEGVGSAEVRLLNASGDILERTLTEPDGDFRLEVPLQEKLTLQATKDRYSIFSATYEQGALKELSGNPMNIGILALEDVVSEREGRYIIRMNKFYFERGSSQLSMEIQQELDKVVEAASRFPGLKFRIEAHTDSRGGRNTNLRLSENRAEAMKKYLVEQGVDEEAVVAVEGFGESQLTNHCEDGVFCLEMLHKQNERYLVEVVNFEEL